MKSILQNDNIEIYSTQMYSTHVVARRFIRTLKKKITSI